MKAPVEKPSDNQRQAAAHAAPEQQDRSDAELQFVDNRAGTTSLRQLQETVDNSPRRQDLTQLKTMMNSSPRSGAMQSLQAMVDNSPRREPMGLQAGTDDVTVQRVEDEDVLQGEFAAESSAQLAQPSEAKPNNTGLPDNLKVGAESLSGLSLDNVKVHYNSSEPAQLNAHAYAQGTDIHLGSGQERHLPHEAWHVVQQKQGRVKPSLQMKGGVDINDNSGLEKEADVMGTKALDPADASQIKQLMPFQYFSDIIQLVPQKIVETNNRDYQDSVNTDFKLVKEEEFDGNEYQIKNQLRHVWWANPDYYKAATAEQEDIFDVDVFLEKKEFGSWTESYEEVSKAIVTEASGDNRAAVINALSIHLLQKFMANAIYTSEEIALLQYQASPLSYQDDGGYLRSFASTFVKALQSKLPGKYGTKELFLSRSVNFRSVLPQYFNVENFNDATLVTSEDINQRLALTIDRIAVNALANGGLDKYLDVPGNFIDFVDFSELLNTVTGDDAALRETNLKKLNKDYGTLVYDTVYKAAAPKLIDGYVNKNFALIIDKASLKQQIKAQLLTTTPGDFSSFLTELTTTKAFELTEHKAAGKLKYEGLVQDQTTDEASDEAQFTKYGAEMEDYEIWLRSNHVKGKGRASEYKIKGNSDYAATPKKVTIQQFLKSRDEEERKSLFTAITKDPSETFVAYLNGQVSHHENLTEQQYIASEMVGLTRLLASTKRGLPMVIMTGGVIKVDPTGYNQSGLLVSDGTMAPAILTALNKSGYVPSPTLANRKMLDQGVTLKTIVQNVIELQSTTKAKSTATKKKLEAVNTDIDGFDPTTYTSIVEVGTQLTAARESFEAFKDLSTSEFEHAQILAPVVSKLITKLGILAPESTYPALALAEIRANMKAAIANQADIVAFVRNIQNLHEQVLLALELNSDAVPDTADLPIPKGDSFQGANFTDYGLKAFSVAYKAAKAQHGESQFNVDAYYNIYFELTQKLQYSQGASGGDVVLQQPKTLQDFKDRYGNTVNHLQFKNPHLVMIDVHPNDASRKEMHMQEVGRLITWLFGGEPKDYRCTVIVDVTLNHITDDDIQSIKKSADRYIATGQCNLVFVQSLTKFAQTGMDKHSGGLMFHYNDSEKWATFNQSVTDAIREDPMDETVQKYFMALFTETSVEQTRYLKKVQDNTKHVYEKLIAEFAKLEVKDEAIELAISDDPKTCYVAFHYDKFAARVFGTDITSDSVHKLNVSILNDALMQLMKQLKLPMSMRQSFGFPISNLGDTGEAIRLTVGIETTEMLDKYVKVITYVNGKLRTKVNESEGAATLADQETRKAFLSDITTDISTMESLQEKLDPMLEQ